LSNFEKKYKAEFLDFIDKNRGLNLWYLYSALPEAERNDETLVKAMRHYDYTVNVTWVMAHLNAARKYLGNAEATGGSEWQKYMHPKYQKRIFFPGLWSSEELESWGANLP
jgi:tryptophan 2,3-dioxygenase